MSDIVSVAVEFREKHDGALANRLDTRLWIRLLSCTTVIEKRVRRRFADEFNTTLPRFDVLASLERSPDGLSMGELSRTLLVSNGNVTSIVRQLEECGFVRSDTRSGDRRALIVSLTQEGREHFRTLARAHHRWIRDMLAEVPEDDQLRLYDLLGTVGRSIATDESTTA